MSFVKRSVSPEYLCRNNPFYATKSVLEDQNKFLWINFLRQLKSIASHANDMFKDLEKNIEHMSDRTKIMESRIDNVNNGLKEAKFPTVERLTSDGYTQSPLQIIPRVDEASITSSDMPFSLKEVYDKCTPLPNFTPLDSLRRDGIISSDLYSKPNFFYEAWLDMMSSDLEAKRNKRKRGRMEKKDERKIADLPSSKQKEIIKKMTSANATPRSGKKQSFHEKKKSVLLNESSNNSMVQVINRTHEQPSSLDVSYTINPVEVIEEDIPQPPSFMKINISETNSISFPTPPCDSENESFPDLPIPPAIPEAPFCPVPDNDIPLPSSAQLTKARTHRSAPPKAAPVVDERDQLLNAIRLGKSLRKVETIPEEENKKAAAPAVFGMDVVSVLQQRIQVMAMSDSEDEDVDEDDDWD